MRVLYDRHGEPVVFLLEGERTTLHLNSGAVVAEVVAGCVFDSVGGFLGWHDEAGLYDPAGKRILTADETRPSTTSGVRVATNGMQRSTPPSLRVRQTIPEKPELQREWSTVVGTSLFRHQTGSHNATG